MWRSRHGVVAMVVTSAIKTSMAKRVGEMTPGSRPTLRTISSIRPRVFMRMPIAVESRRSRPVQRAAR
jgi:hypothetical protein